MEGVDEPEGTVQELKFYKFDCVQIKMCNHHRFPLSDISIARGTKNFKLMVAKGAPNYYVSEFCSTLKESNFQA